MIPLDDYKPLRPPQLPRRPLPKWIPIVALIMTFLVVPALIVALALAGYESHRAQVAARVAAEKRADAAEAQLALMLKSGDQGILLAQIEGMGAGTLRFVPRARR